MKPQAVRLAKESTETRKARRLPMFGPGIEIPLPLHLVPAYIALYGLKPTGWRAPDTLTVRRLTDEEKEGKHESK